MLFLILHRLEETPELRRPWWRVLPKKQRQTTGHPENTLTDELRNIARIVRINRTNVLKRIGKMDKNTYRHRITMGLMSL